MDAEPEVMDKSYRLGATSHCIVCGVPDLPGVLSAAHIHRRDSHLPPHGDERQVFRLCWGHHHGDHDQNWISTEELIEAEVIWLTDKKPEACAASAGYRVNAAPRCPRPGTHLRMEGGKEGQGCEV